MGGGIGEFELIDRLKAGAGTSTRLLEGIGDDAAVVRPSGLSVTSVDAAVDGRHFQRDWAGPESIAAKAVGAALSDLAAMAATPGEIYVALGLSGDLEEGFIERLASAVNRVAGDAGAVLAGGDTVSSPVLFLAVTVVGYVDGSQSLVRRSGARAGQLVAVTGRLGGAAAGLKLLEQPDLADRVAPELRAGLVDRQLEPVPRLAESLLLARAGAAAMIDISDGPAADLGHIAAASKVSIEIESESVPVHPGVSDLVADPDFVLSGGEEYELALTIAPGAFDAARSELAAVGCELTRIGSVAEGRGLVVTRGGRPVDPPAGHVHLI